MKWIITGGAGFIGSNFAKRLFESGGVPIVIDTLIRPRVEQNSIWLKEQFGIETIRVDIRDKSSLSEVFSKHTDAAAIIHLAGQVSLLDSIKEPRNDFEVNVSGTFNVLECLRDFVPDAHLIYSSTNKVYGDLEQIHFEEGETRYFSGAWPKGFDETLEISPAGGYGVSKCSAEFFISDWGKTYGLKTSVLRQSSIYGERQFSTSDQGWAAFFVESFLRNSDFVINGNGKQVRDLLHVEDLFNLVQLILQFGRSATGSFNVGGGAPNSLSLLELFNFLNESTGNFPKFQSGPKRPHDQLVYISNNAKISSVTGWEPTIDYRSGLERLIAWTQESI
jgi:CDP-paratose 2-epimerase